MNKLREIFTESWAIALHDLKIRDNFIKRIIKIIILLFIIILISKGVSLLSSPLYEYSSTKFYSHAILAYFISMSGLMMGANVVLDRKGFVKLLLSTPISPISIFLGKIIVIFVSSIDSFSIMILLLTFYLKTFNISRLPLIILLSIFSFILFTGLGFLLMAPIRKKSTGENILSLINIFMLLFSGIFYPINKIPNLFKVLIYLNPLTYTVDSIRYVTTGHSFIPICYSLTIIFILALFLPLLGSLLYVKYVRKF